MSYLLDTHLWLWMVGDPERLDDASLAVVSDASSSLFLSAASTWEISIKVGLGKLTLPRSPADYVPHALERSRVRPLAVTLAHSLQVAELPRHHRDPFDRLLVAQAQVEELTLITADRALAAYDVPVLLVRPPDGGVRPG